MDSKEYSWAWVTGDRLLSHGPCELLYAYLVVSAASTDSSLYDGENTTGDLIVTLKAAAVTGHPFKPKEPIYCRKGLYVDVGTSVSGIFVQWRELSGKEG
jgi:hypothetical protein